MLTCLVPVLFTFHIQGVLKLKKNNSGAKGLRLRAHIIYGAITTGSNYQYYQSFIYSPTDAPVSRLKKQY